MSWPSAGERPESPVRATDTHRREGTTTVMPPDQWRSPLNTVSGRKLGLLIGDFARFINSEVALLSEPAGQGGSHQQ
jgi:hypothetical protein